MAENPAEKVAIPALATTAYLAEQPKKGRWTYQKESLTANTIKHVSISEVF